MGKKQMLTGALAACMFLTSGMTALADRVDAVIDKPYVALGADLKESERAKVLELLGVTEAELKDYDVVTITNEDEHKYLDSYLDAGVIGTRALSSVMVVGKEAGNGINVNTNNISYCTSGMYRNALITAGVEDADITVAGPFSISGTAALVGAMKAYGTMTGEEIDSESADAATNELVLTGQLGESVGREEAAQLVALVKNKVLEGDLSSAEEITEAVEEASEELKVSLTEDQKAELTKLMQKIGSLDLDIDNLKSQAQGIYDKLKDMDIDLSEAKGVLAKIGDFFKELFKGIMDFFKGLF